MREFESARKEEEDEPRDLGVCIGDWGGNVRVSRGSCLCEGINL
jgi:hypothetical protein